MRIELYHISTVSTLAALPALTPEQADELFNNIMQRRDCFHNGDSITWWPHYDDEGRQINLIDGVMLTQPITSPPKSGAKPNPHSLTQLAPWDDEGISRAYWYIRRAQLDKHATRLAPLPESMRRDSKQGLKLHSSLASFAHCYGLETKVLWEKVCEVLRGMV